VCDSQLFIQIPSEIITQYIENGNVQTSAHSTYTTIGIIGAGPPGIALLFVHNYGSNYHWLNQCISSSFLMQYSWPFSTLQNHFWFTNSTSGPKSNTSMKYMT